MRKPLYFLPQHFAMMALCKRSRSSGETSYSSLPLYTSMVRRVENNLAVLALCSVDTHLFAQLCAEVSIEVIAKSAQ